MREQLWTAVESVAVAGVRSYAPVRLRNKGESAGSVVSMNAPSTDAARLGQICAFTEDPSVQTTHMSVQKRRIEGPYPWRPPE